MPNKVYQFDSEFGPILVEARDQQARSGKTPVARKGVVSETIEKAEQSFENATKTIESASQALLKLFQTDNTKEVTLEFGVTIGAQAGAIIAQSSIDAQIKVTIKWGKAETKKVE